MPEDKSLDLTGVGKLANAIPPEAWGKAVEAACQTVRECLAPITATASGIGRLIQARFNRLEEVEKINSAAIFAKAHAKIKKSGKVPAPNASASVIVYALEESALQDDATLQELWSNLVAQEFTRGGVHPEIPRILARITAEDANTLISILNTPITVDLRQPFLFPSQDEPATFSLAALISAMPDKPSLSHSVLAAVNLIRQEGENWFLTVLGEAFIEAVTDPSAKTDPSTSNENPTS